MQNLRSGRVKWTVRTLEVLHYECLEWPSYANITSELVQSYFDNFSTGLVEIADTNFILTVFTGNSSPTPNLMDDNFHQKQL